MGKVEDMRAMKQQRRADQAAAAGAPAAGPRTSARSAGAATVRAETPAPVETPAADAAPPDALCGHRSLGSRTCTRPAGHAEKNHRYAPVGDTAG